MDSDLEAFSRNPTDGSFAILNFQLAAFTKYLNEMFPGNLHRRQKPMHPQIEQTQDEPQWIVAQRLLSALTIPGFK